MPIKSTPYFHMELALLKNLRENSLFTYPPEFKVEIVCGVSTGMFLSTYWIYPGMLILSGFDLKLINLPDQEIPDRITR